MKINWTVRLKNKVWLATFLSFIVSTVYQWLGYFDIAPVVTQDAVLQLVTAVLQVLSLLGLIVDPTTAGVAEGAKDVVNGDDNTKTTTNSNTKTKTTTKGTTK